MRSMTHDNVRAAVDRLVGEGNDKVGRFFKPGAAAGSQQARAAEFMTVHADHNPVGLAARFVNPSEIVLDISGGCFGFDRKASILDKAMAEQIDFGFLVVRDLLITIKMFACALVAHFESQLATDPLQLLQRRGINAIAGSEPARINPRPAASVGSLFTRLVPWPERRSGRDWRHPSVRRIEISWRACLSEIFP